VLVRQPAAGGVLSSLVAIAAGAGCDAAGPPSVAVGMTISFNFPAAAPVGARLTAEGSARRQGRHARFCAMAVRTGAGAPVATVHGVTDRAEPRGPDRE
jgi:acyl-coenzyme A thioesterase PaaI-like protein